MRWLRRKHPEAPSTWEDDVKDARKSVNKAKGKGEIDDLWTAHKVTFSRIQHGKCAYCELGIEADANGGDIDHYRPKAKVTQLLPDPATWGREVEGHNSRDGAAPRKTEPVGNGYFWLAYDWGNYLLACGTCNQKWKGNLFPIEGGHARAPTRASAKAEKPLLLNPYRDIDPAEHLEFDEIGMVSARNGSDIGFETIRTCALTRETLQSKRRLFAKDACIAIQRFNHELARDPWDKRKLRRAVHALLCAGASKRPFSGMVRILWVQQNAYGLTWKELRELRKKL